MEATASTAILTRTLPAQGNACRRILPLILLLVAALFCCDQHARAQQDVGYVLGTITDPGVVVGAKVHIVNESTGIAQDLMTNDSGFYQSQPLQPGSYSIVVAMKGFASATERGLIVDAASHVTANVKLEVGSVSTTVTVESTPPSLDTVDAQIGNTVDTRAVQELPVNGRSVLALATLSPGVESAVGATSQGFTNRGTQASAIRISGGVPGGNNNLLDGVSNLQNYLGEIAINVKSDSVQEFRIMTGVIPAQFGYTSGGVINVITRSGQNQFHGSAYEFFRNDYLDATIAIPKPAFGKPELRFNNYGGTLGGPIKHDKAFFFANYEEYSFVNGQPTYSSVPTVIERGGDFSDLGKTVSGVCTPYAIYDPSTGSTTTARAAFAGNKIPASQQDTVALAAQALFYPLPNNAVGSYDPCTHANNYLANPKLVSKEKTALGRVDYRLSDKDSVFARYAYYQNFTNNAQGYSPLFYRNDTLQNYDAVLSETHIFSSSLINDTRIAVLRSDFPFQAATAGQNYAAKLGLPNDNAIVSPIFTNGPIALNGTVGFRSSTTIELVDDGTKTLGAHTVRFGFDGRFTEGYNNQSGAASGSFGFSASQTAAGTNTSVTAGTGSAYASYLIGAVSSASVQLAQGTAYRKWQYAGYIQDDWHVNQRLTLNLGLRYDYQAQPYEKNNGLGDFDITKLNSVNGYLGAVRYAGVNGEGSNFVKENWNDWGPRVGFALVLTDDNKTVARGGFAMYYPTTAQASYNQAAGNPNGFGNLTTSYSAATPTGPAFTLANGFPYAPSLPLGAAGGQNAFLGQAGFYVVPTAKDPQSQQYTLTLSRELPFKTVLDVSYLGNHGVHFNLGGLNLNQLDPQFYGLGTAYLNASVANPYAGKVPGSLGAATITRANLMRHYPYMQSVSESNPRISNFDGNYLYVSAQRRASQGLQIQGAYTYGKLMSLPIYSDIATTAGITQTGGSIQNSRNISADYSVDAIDVTHRGVVALLYDLPVGKGKRFLTNSSSLVDRILGGFQFNTVMTAESGRPLGFSGASNQGVAIRPNLLPGVSVATSAPNRNLWFNTAAFVNPADYTFGNAPRYYSKVRGPGALNFDASIFKTVRITERSALELRLEGFNVFNKTNLGMPNTSFSAGAPADPTNPTAEGGVNTNSNFGKILSSSAARQVQLAAKFRF
jgi:outer membrane receptor protein involved in Fe transport